MNALNGLNVSRGLVCTIEGQAMHAERRTASMSALASLSQALASRKHWLQGGRLRACLDFQAELYRQIFQVHGLAILNVLDEAC